MRDLSLFGWAALAASLSFAAPAAGQEAAPAGMARNVAEMKDGKPVSARPGAFVLMPSRHVHRFSCSAECTLYVYSDGVFDTHYVDAHGQEITPADALKAVEEVAATETK